MLAQVVQSGIDSMSLGQESRRSASEASREWRVDQCPMSGSVARRLFRHRPSVPHSRSLGNWTSGRQGLGTHSCSTEARISKSVTIALKQVLSTRDPAYSSLSPRLSESTHEID